MLPIVDTHQHMWDTDQLELPWLEGAGALAQSHTMDDYLTAIDGLGVVKSVYMEVDAAPRDRLREAEFATALCARDDNPMAAAVVAAEPGSDGFADHVRGLADNPSIKGIRLVLHVPERQTGCCLGDRFVQDVQLLGELGLSFDICLRPGELADGVELADRCPDTRFIVDHCGNAHPAIVAGALTPTAAELAQDPGALHGRDQWMRDMEAFGQRDNVVGKISGIVARVADPWSAADLAPTVNHCLDVFDPERVVVASDWPVCTLGAPLAAWFTALREIVSTRSEADQRRLLHDNAVRLYGLE